MEGAFFAPWDFAPSWRVGRAVRSIACSYEVHGLLIKEQLFATAVDPMPLLGIQLHIYTYIV